ncbi:hypothetical protein JXR93_10445 [bacterium]|nr:hypothetical protein [bacterium]
MFKFKLLLIVSILLFLISCDDSKTLTIDKNIKTDQIKSTNEKNSSNYFDNNLNQLSNSENCQNSKIDDLSDTKVDEFRFSDKIEILEIAENGFVVKGNIGIYPENGTFIPKYKIEVFDKNGKKVDFPTDEVIDIRLSISGNSAIYVTTQSDLYLYDFTTKKTDFIAHKTMSTSQISPNEELIAYFSGEMPEFELFVYDIKTKKSKQITNASMPSWSADFSENSDKIYFIHSPEGKPALYQYKLENNHLEVINPELKNFPTQRKPFSIIDNKMIFQNEKNEIISVDFFEKNIKTITKGSFINLNKKELKLTLFEDSNFTKTIKIGNYIK